MGMKKAGDQPAFFMGDGRVIWQPSTH